MIKRLRVKNYKSLKNLDIEIGKRNLLVGPNMSGKSNLIDCLKFLSHICILGVTQAFLNRGGFQEVAWKGEEKGPIYFSLTIEQQKDFEEQKIFEYEISIAGSPTGLISIEREYLEVKKAEEISTLIDLKNGQGKITHTDGRPAFNIGDPTRCALEFSVPGWEGMELKNYIAGWRYYHLSPAIMKQENAATHQHYLVENGQNFSSWLMTLQSSYPEEFRSIKQVAKDSLLGIEEILTPPTQFATTHLTSREKHLSQPINIWHMSDGEILFLAWLSLIFAPASLGAPLFCVEELENHLHPRLLEILVEVLDQRQRELGPQAAQIIVTTHSPYLVDKVNLDDLIVFEKSKGATKYNRPASKSHLRELLEREELGLGDLWYSGALGG
jgi:predicted ATPase